MRALSVLVLVFAGCRSPSLLPAEDARGCTCAPGPAGSPGPAGPQGLPGMDAVSGTLRGSVTISPPDVQAIVLDVPASGRDVESWSLTVVAAQLDGAGVPLPDADSVIAYHFPAATVIRGGGTARVIAGPPLVDGNGPEPLPLLDADGQRLRVHVSAAGAFAVAWSATAIAD